MSDTSPVRLGRIFVFWVPLAATWLMMSLEGPFLAAIIARLTEPKQNLAAFGVAFAFALIIEAPVIMILSAATALVADGASFRRLRNFSYALDAAVTAAMIIVLVPPVFDLLARDLIGLPGRVAELTWTTLVIMLPWPAAIGYRRFFQGILIRSDRTGRVAIGTVIRIAGMATTAALLYVGSDLPGAWIGAAALSVGVTTEAIASRWMAARAVRELCSPDAGAPPEPPPPYGKIARFYAPLALTSTVALGVHPIVTFFMGRAPMALESLAVLPVINALVFIFRSAGLSYQEVAIAMLARGRANAAPVTRFAALLGGAASLGLAAIAWTPLADVWFRDLSGLSPDLAAFAVTPVRILTLLPALSVLLALQRAALVHDRRTRGVYRATVVEVGCIVAVLLVTIVGLGLVGATAAAVAFILGRLVGNLYLLPPSVAVLTRPVAAVPRAR